MKNPAQLTWQRVQQALSYCPLSGEFTWQIPGANRRKIGEQAGVLDKSSGYVLVGLDGTQAYGHQLAYFWTKGVWAPRRDHRNRDRGDNRWANLRLSTQSQNTHNQLREKGRLPGAYKDSRSPSWFSSIRAHGKGVYLGVFPSEEEAHLAYPMASIFYYGEFSPFFPKENYDPAI